jgi:hypothetical protein
MKKRKYLTIAVMGTAFIGAVMTAIPFIKSLSVSEARESAAWATCDVSKLDKGEVLTCGYAMIYHRTEEDKLSISKYTHLLEDPLSKKSKQPDRAINKWRSENENYFIFRPWAPIRRCSIEFHKEYEFWWEAPENKALKALPYFTELCEGRTWDMSGRLYQRGGHPPEENLTVPNVKWISDTRVLVYGG